MKARRTSAMVATSSRNGSRARRAAMAPASVAVGPSDAAALRALATHHLGRARGDARAGARLADYCYRLRARGKGELVAVVARALAFDGGTMLRELADATDRARVERAVLLFVLVVAEHRIASTAAMGLALRACLQGTVLDGALAGTFTGKASKDEAARADRLDGPARLNLLSALQVERQAADVRATAPSIDVGQRIAEMKAQRAREIAADAELEDEGEEEEKHAAP